MTNWEYSVDVIKFEYGDSEGWSIHNSAYGHIKLENRLNEFGKFGWELVSMMPVLSEDGIPVIPPMLYVVFKKPKDAPIAR